MSMYNRQAIKYDAHLTLLEAARENAEEWINALKTRVRSWTENELDNRDTPTYEHFIDEYPEYDFEELIATIADEMEGVIKLASVERRRIPRIS